MKNPVLIEGSYHDHCGKEDGSDHTEDFTLRDFFAGAALIGILSDIPNYDGGIMEVVEESYKLADAMLQARAKVKS